MVNAFKQESFDLCFFEQKTHYEIVDIVVFDEFSSLGHRQIFETIDFCDNRHHELSKLLNLHNYIIEIFDWFMGEIFGKTSVDRSEKRASTCVLFKDAGPFEEKIKSLRILWNFDFFFVKDIDLLYQGFIVFDVFAKRLRPSLSFLLLLLQIGFIFQNQTWVFEFIF